MRRSGGESSAPPLFFRREKQTVRRKDYEQEEFFGMVDFRSWLCGVVRMYDECGDGCG